MKFLQSSGNQNLFWFCCLTCSSLKVWRVLFDVSNHSLRFSYPKITSSSIQLIEGYGPFGHMNLKALGLVLFVLPVG